ncbi:2-amino-4-hydroxy-6-hydroxymethyldihydropteridine diphosphokinase [Alkalimarinus coralli]|uniref:2-amino-4-hydroxy-6- hydroxymethyldihydropteridine diphosphokinase n=1 Tax=Alkalimarinus coralli TaxID=2935863 RepID=UPI00202AE278|nr:2-amino-4-hydroxy-6-hydroxymethyldihydropteridine diphosphokinase [Alkalimarinus coralli]
METQLNRVYIGLGSNLNEPANQLRQALVTLEQHPHITLVVHSSFYGSKPVGPQDQPDFVNAVALLETSLTPEALLEALKLIEKRQGRIKKRHWGERTIDLDILLFGDIVMDTPDLTIPHKELANRDFVLRPLLELNNNLSLPDGTLVSALLQTCPDNQLRVYSTPE